MCFCMISSDLQDHSGRWVLLHPLKQHKNIWIVCCVFPEISIISKYWHLMSSLVWLVCKALVLSQKRATQSSPLAVEVISGDLLSDYYKNKIRDEAEKWSTFSAIKGIKMNLKSKTPTIRKHWIFNYYSKTHYGIKTTLFNTGWVSHCKRCNQSCTWRIWRIMMNILSQNITDGNEKSK